MQSRMLALFARRGAQGDAADAAPDRSRVLREQTDLLIKQSRTGLFTAIAAGTLLGVPMIKSTGVWPFVIWLAALIAGYVLRQRLMERAQAHGSLDEVLRITVVGAAVLGFIITVPGLLFFPYTDEGGRAFLTMFHLAWMVAAATVLGVFPPSYKVYLVCSMSNVAIGWWLSADRIDAAVFTVALLPYFFVLARFSDRVGSLIEESVNIRHERERLVQQLKQSLSETEAAQLARSRFLASASHDLLQPVHALLLLSGLSRDLPAGAKRDEAIRQLHTTAESIDAMFRGLLDLARYDAGTMQPQLASMPVAHVLRSVQAAYQARCAEKGVVLTVETAPGIYVHADPAMFDRIVRNLVDNAVKFTPSGTIAVRCRAEPGSEGSGDRVVIEVQDSGVGIAAADLAHVQEAFYRGSSAREVEADGVGLGLANSTHMAELLHGRIEVSSTQGEGTTVRFTLPAGVGPKDALAAGTARRPLRFRRIVLVEDDRTARTATELWLREHGATVVSAVDAAAALEQCKALGLDGSDAEHTPQFLLLDYRLGATTGVQALRELRDRFGPLPAAIVSGEDLKPEELPAGVPLLAKPLRPERLLALLS